MLCAARLAWTDWTRRRLYNREVLALAGLALLYGVLDPGWSPAWTGFLGALLVGLPLFALRVCGGGDVKLLAALALWLPGQLGLFALASAVLGLALTLLMLWQGRRTVPYGTALIGAAGLVSILGG
ncbi:prepilin peptidase [Jeongeupia wiesaeckerbachi]|uniref:prepilin peptidase n=1 Tax=Jeongeupia wiesaeckerbachi TaxID=3051218 RepID=UPI003D8033D6